MRPVDGVKEVGIEVEGMPQFAFDAVGTEVEQGLDIDA